MEDEEPRVSAYESQSHGEKQREINSSWDNIHLLQPRPLIIVALIHAHTRLGIPRAPRQREKFLELVHARKDDRVPKRQQHELAHVQAYFTARRRGLDGGRVPVPPTTVRLSCFAEGEEEWVCLEWEEYLYRWKKVR